MCLLAFNHLYFYLYLQYIYIYIDIFYICDSNYQISETYKQGSHCTTWKVTNSFFLSTVQWFTAENQTI